jgi:hypothetical protein
VYPKRMKRGEIASKRSLSLTVAGLRGIANEFWSRSHFREGEGDAVACSSLRKPA